MTSQTLEKTRDLSVNDVAGIFGVTYPTVYKMIARGELDSYKAGRSRRITAESVDRLRSGGKRRA